MIRTNDKKEARKSDIEGYIQKSRRMKQRVSIIKHLRNFLERLMITMKIYLKASLNLSVNKIYST